MLFANNTELSVDNGGGGGSMDAKRAGRPWGLARGSCQEINELVGMMRTWLDESGVSVRALHEQLMPEHFSDQQVPELHRLRDRLAGVDLAWELVEAVADICFPADSAQTAAARLALARQLWTAAEQSPTAHMAADVLAVTRELLDAKDRTIAAYQEIDRARHAFQASEHGRLQALQAAMLVFALLGQAQAKIAELSRQVDLLRAGRSSADSMELEAFQLRLRRARSQEKDIKQALTHAEEERDIAQRVADHAARRIQALEAEVELLRDGSEGTADAHAPAEPADVARVDMPSADSADEAMDDVDRALDKVREVLEHGHEAVREAAQEVGFKAAPPSDGIRTGREQVVVGQVLNSRPSDADHSADEEEDNAAQLSPTTANNPLTGSDAVDNAALAHEPAADRQRYTGAATRRIARGLDLDEILLGLCRSAVPAFADAIVVYLRDPLPVGDDRPSFPLRLRLRRTEGALTGQVDPSGETVPDALDVPKNIEVALDGLLAEVLRAVRPVFAETPRATGALNELLGGAEGTVPSGRRALLVPLRGRRRVIGVAMLLRRPDRHAFEADDLLVAAQLATHTALSVDKAALYSRQPSMGHTLQQVMLPHHIPQSPSVEVAIRYLPASESARVGGDWFDVIPLPGGRVALAVGDVMGHSITSAAIMGQLRTTVRALAGLDLPPQQVLRHLDEQSQLLDDDRLATCVYAVYDPAGGSLTIANAGHPPPVLLHPDGLAEVLRVPPGAPIGIGGVPYDTVEVPASAGSTLLLYTDGLVESRRQDVWVGIELLRERLQRAALDGVPPLEQLCDQALEILGPGDLDDDIALLAARFNGNVH